jgi:hypothetical protein
MTDQVPGQSNGRWTPPEPGKDVLALAKRTRELGERVRVLEEQKLAENLEELALVVRKLAEKPESKGSGVWNWASMTPEQQLAAWEYLLGWMDTILLTRFPTAYKEILRAPCWFQHPDAVEELTSLCTTWLWAYTDPEAGPVRTGEWLDRWLPACERHMGKILKRCEGQSHVDPLQYVRETPRAELDAMLNGLRARAATPA